MLIKKIEIPISGDYGDGTVTIILKTAVEYGNTGTLDITPEQIELIKFTVGEVKP